MLSPEALENDKKSGLPLVSLKKIYADAEFNCRGNITAPDVVDIARDIAKRGLVEPIILRKLWPTENIKLAQGFEYSLVAGFRRYFAYRVNEAECIPAIVREIKNEFDCKDVNAVENLQRQDLNILQEAKSIQHYILAGWTREDIGKRVSKSPGWVQQREELLQMPEEIQVAAAQGYLVQEDLKLLYKQRRNRDEMLRLAGIIRDRRKMGQKTNILSKVKVKKRAFETKQRKTIEVQDMMSEVRALCLKADREKVIKVGDLFSDQGNSVITRLLGWVCGFNTNVDAYTGLKKLSEVIGAEYMMPQFMEVSE